MWCKQVSKSDPKLTLVKDPLSYFKDLVDEVLEKRGLKTGVHTEHYIVNLLAQFMHAENLYSVDEDGGHRRQEALANIMKAAVDAADYLQKQKSLKKLGDISLYTAGFFGESLNRKMVDVDYYIDMGKVAYGNLAQIVPDEDFSRLFSELAVRFDKFVDVLAEISEKTQLQKSPTDVLRLYELWLKTKSERAEQQLKDAGIIPDPSLKRTKQ